MFEWISECGQTISLSNSRFLDFRQPRGSRSLLLLRNATNGIMCDQKFFVGRDDERVQRGIVGADLSLQGHGCLIPVFMQPQARPFQTLTDFLADRR